MRINGFLLFIFIFLCTLVLSSIYLPLRYLRYFLPVIPFLFFLSSKKELTLDMSVFKYYAIFIFMYSCIVLLLFLQNIFFTTLSYRFVPNAIFILSPLLFIVVGAHYFNKNYIDRYVYLILLVNIFLFFYEEGSDLLNVLTDLSILKSAFITSIIPTESNLAYVFGFLAIYFFITNKNIALKIIPVIFFFLCFKRIAIVAVLLCIVLYYVLNYFNVSVAKHRTKLAFLGVLINFLYVRITAMIVSGTFDKLVMDATGFSTDRFLMGRKQFYTQVFSRAQSNWFGLGLGKVDDIMFDYMKFPINLHSEVLRVFFEFGVIVFVVWLFVLFYQNLFSNKSAVFLVYFNILILTDNVFVYFDVMVYFYFFILIFLFQESNKQKSNTI